MPNDDLSAWTCSLRPGVVFHDGSTFDANDVVASYTAGLDAASPLHTGNSGVFEYYDDRDEEFYLWFEGVSAAPWTGWSAIGVVELVRNHIYVVEIWDPVAELIDELKEALPKVRKQIERGRDITHRLLQFARKTEISVEHAVVNTAVSELLPFLEKECRLVGVAIHRDCRPDLPKVGIDETQLQEILMNLTKNAIDALSGHGGGNIWLATHEENGKVVVVVRDDGPGIDEAIRHRLFDPFVSTKSIKQGTGLGLSICYAIVKRCDGEIRVASEPNKGATFTVLLPRHNPVSKKA